MLYRLVFQDTYLKYKRLQQIEYVIDIIFCIEIIMNFFKRTPI